MCKSEREKICMLYFLCVTFMRIFCVPFSVRGVLTFESYLFSSPHILFVYAICCMLYDLVGNICTVVCCFLIAALLCKKSLLIASLLGASSRFSLITENIWLCVDVCVCFRQIHLNIFVCLCLLLNEHGKQKRTYENENGIRHNKNEHAKKM